ncbi:MAG: hypothetical protein IJ887_03030 [Prevotella sp.]|nr:hypothetical protein [Prevotella sp.]MBR6187709.1 hypothetical protein [Prevotella sp.]
MQKNETLSQIIDLIEQRRLGRAVNALENFLLSHPSLKRDMESLMALQNDFNLMTDYWQRGFNDPEREQVYSQLLKRLYVLATNIMTRDKMANSRFLTSVHNRPRHIRKDWTMSNVRHQLEDFVSDVAMLELETDDNRQERRKQVYQDHQLLMHDLFDYILTSRLWKESLGEAFTDILLSPTIDTNDQQLIVSAITLSALNAFGFNKFSVLMNVFMKTTDPAIRQRALVGWVLCIDESKVSLYPEMAEMINKACEDETCRNELTELQMQLFYCMDAEHDQKKIHDEIIPDILKGSNIKVTRHGLEEVDDDTLEDILHPDTSERNMERMEESMKQMATMQKEGSDIYFGGFAQMKRMPFYNELSNWFVPFFPQHPAISNIWENTKGKKFLQIITQIGAFCDSDKYSFVLAFEQVLKQFPTKMLKMIENGEASPLPLGGMIELEEQRQPAFIRRMYLQNLYRFFRLYPMRSEFASPFDDREKYLFFANPLFGKNKLQENMTEVAAFLMKHRKNDEALSVLSNCDLAANTFDYNMLMGNLLMRMPLDTELSATEFFRHALDLRPDSEKALSGYARAQFRYHHYETALTSYEKLLKLKPEHTGFMLNAAICMTNLQKNEEALKLLFKLDYEQPDNHKVKRVLAWVLTMSKRYEQAGKAYQQLLSQEKPEPVDMLNYGYCLWFQGDIMEAIVHFKQFLLTNGDENYNLEQEFMGTEHSLIASHNITDTEIYLMLDTLA